MDILITGTSSGLGEGLALHYLEKGYQVFGISRRANVKLDRYPNFNFLSLDLSEFKLIVKKVPDFLRGTERLHLVILNAGMLSEVKDLKDTSLEEISRVMDINVWSNKVLIDVLFDSIPRIEQIVGISSGASQSGARGWNAYSLSKTTLNMLINLYSKEFTHTHFCALAPGLIDTQMQAYIHSLPEDDKYPVVRKLKSLRGTTEMPDPKQAASAITEGIIRARNFESGSYLDMRKF